MVINRTALVKGLAPGRGRAVFARAGNYPKPAHPHPAHPHPAHAQPAHAQPAHAQPARPKPARPGLAQRAALARQPRPDGVSGPSLRLFLAEFGALTKKYRKPLRVAKALHPQPVMLLPGFGASPLRMQRMMDALAVAGHPTYEWGLGINFGPTPENFAFLMGRIASISRREGAPVALVGWSLGGLFAREIAKRMPDKVSRVITLGTPFSGDRRNNNAWRAYQLVTGHLVDAPPIECDFAVKPPVPTIALWSPKDGVISPRSACGWPGERDVAVAVRCNHLRFCRDPGVIAEVLRQMDARFD